MDLKIDILKNIPRGRFIAKLVYRGKPVIEHKTKKLTVNIVFI